LSIMELNELTYIIRGCIFKVHATLGPGLLESVYEASLAYELIKAGLHVQVQLGLPVQYDDVFLDLGFRMDILVENEVVLELKSIESLHDVHKKTLLTYLRLAKKKLGMLVNFNVATLVDKESLLRIIN
jgi:GxxExxY protein